MKSVPLICTMLGYEELLGTYYGNTLVTVTLTRYEKETLLEKSCPLLLTEKLTYPPKVKISSEILLAGTI